MIKRKSVIQQAKQTFPPPSIAVFNEEYMTRDELVSANELVPTLGITEEILVYYVGAEKHGPDSWRDGMAWSRCITKLVRHLGRFVDGESRCPKDGQHHLASIKFWCNALMEYEQTHPELDDVRVKSPREQHERQERRA